MLVRRFRAENNCALCMMVYIIARADSTACHKSMQAGGGERGCWLLAKCNFGLKRINLPCCPTTTTTTDICAVEKLLFGPSLYLEELAWYVYLYMLATQKCGSVYVIRLYLRIL